MSRCICFAMSVFRRRTNRKSGDVAYSECSVKDFRSVHDVKATALGVEQSRFKAELDFNGREITRAYLHQNVHMPSLLKVGD